MSRTFDLNAGQYLHHNGGDDEELSDVSNDISPIFTTERTFLQHDLWEKDSQILNI